MILISALALAGCGNITVTKEYKNDKNETCYTIDDNSQPANDTPYNWCSENGDPFNVGDILQGGWARKDGIDGYVP
jgi:hypothetical protein